MTRKTLGLISVTLTIALGVMLWPSDAAAQRRGVRRGTTRVVVSGGYYSPFYSPFYYGSYGWDPFFQYPYRPYPPPYGWYGSYYEPGADLRVQVTQRQAEVFVDGYFAGTVDDFDGALQRLRVPLGEHEITVYLDGFRSIHQKMLFRSGETYRIKETLQPLAAGDTAEPRPAPAQQPGAAERPDDAEPMTRPAPRGRVAMPPPDRGDRGDRASAFGTLAIRVQPVGAEVLIDGQRWDGPEGEARLSIDVQEGSHRVEIRKEGFKPYSATVRVRRGETVPVNVSLPPGE